MSESTPAKPASTVLLALALLAYSGAHLLNNTLLASAPVRGALDRLQVASGGWVEPVLVRSQVVLGAFLVVVLWIGRRPAADVGWRSELVLPGFLTWLVAWLALQASLVAAQLVNGQTIVWHTRWTMLGAGGALGAALAQALGHALAEDTAFRGFYLPELRARFARLGSGATLLALAGAALLFGLAHLPTRYFVKGSSEMDLLGEQWGFFSAGLALGVACLATRNLFAVVALHVLLNDPAPLVDSPGALLRRSVLAVFAGMLVLALALRLAARRRAGVPESADGADADPAREAA